MSLNELGVEHPPPQDFHKSRTDFLISGTGGVGTTDLVLLFSGAKSVISARNWPHEIAKRPQLHGY